MANNSDDINYTISGTISNDKVTIDKFMVGEKDVINNSFFNSNDNKNIKNIKGNIKDKLIEQVKGEVELESSAVISTRKNNINNSNTESKLSSAAVIPIITSEKEPFRFDSISQENDLIKAQNATTASNANATAVANGAAEGKGAGKGAVEGAVEGAVAEQAADINNNGGGLFRSPSANLKLAMNNPFATAVSSSNNIARDMLTNTVSKTLKSVAPRNNATKRFRRFFKTKRRNSNKKARKYTRYHK